MMTLILKEREQNFTPCSGFVAYNANFFVMCDVYRLHHALIDDELPKCGTSRPLETLT